MKQPMTYAFLIFLLMLLSPWGGRGWALDEEGCLTCHQYPGLTRTQPDGTFKVFHIDEKRYLASAHGKTACRKCHTTVHKVPHVGETTTNCTNGCHTAEKDKKLLAEYDKKTLHVKETSYVIRLADGSSCSECHGLYPHKSNELARAFINMHVSFMTCETCHINRDIYPALKYDWASSETAEFAGEPFGSRFNPKLGGAAESVHFISRIAVFLEEKGKQKAMQNTWDTGKAKEYLSGEKSLTPETKKEKLAYFHRDIHKMEISVTCNECHSDKSILDFKQLGFSEKRTKDLIYINIKGLVTKYKIFYLPDLFEQ